MSSEKVLNKKEREREKEQGSNWEKPRPFLRRKVVVVGKTSSRLKLVWSTVNLIFSFVDRLPVWPDGNIIFQYFAIYIIET